MCIFMLFVLAAANLRAKDLGLRRSYPAPAPKRARHTCHILPPSEIDLGLFLVVDAGSEGKYLFHRIG